MTTPAFFYIKLTNTKDNGGTDLWVNMVRVEGMTRRDDKTLLYLEGDAGQCFFAVRETPEEIKGIVDAMPHDGVMLHPMFNG